MLYTECIQSLDWNDEVKQPSKKPPVPVPITPRPSVRDFSMFLMTSIETQAVSLDLRLRTERI